jgi:YVTN family beta-propeller protein
MNYNQHAVRQMAAVLLAVLAISGCNLSTQATATPAPTLTPSHTPTQAPLVELDLCSLLTVQQVEETVGSAVSASTDQGIANCTYSSSDGMQPISLSVSAAQGEDAKTLTLAGLQIVLLFGGDEATLQAFQSLAENAETLSVWEVVQGTFEIFEGFGYQIEPASTFGEQALWGWSEPGIGTLVIVEGETYLSFNITGLEHAEARRAAENLAPSALEALPERFSVPTSGEISMQASVDFTDEESTSTPEAMAVQPVSAGGPAVWVANFGSHSVSRIDPETLQVMASIDVGQGPVDVVALPGSVFVANQNDGSVVIIDPVSNTIQDRIEADTVGYLRVDADERYIYVAACNDALVRIYTREPNPTLAADLPLHGCWNVESGEGSLWVPVGENKLLRFDPDTRGQLASIQVGNGPSLIEAYGGTIWVGHTNQKRLYKIDPASNQAFSYINIESEGYLLGLGVGEGAVWVAIQEGILKIDPSTGSFRRAETPMRPTGVTAGYGYVWVTHYAEGVVSRLDAETLESAGSVQVGMNPWGIAVTP